MKQLTINIFNLPPMPRNRSHMLTVAGKRPMNIKTQLCREFEKDLEFRLKDYADDIAAFVYEFNPLKHYIQGNYTIYTPVVELFTKEGKISSRSVDSDAHKSMRDVIYKVIGLDDKLERDTRFFTPQSTDGNWNYVITYYIRPIEQLRIETELL